ncbi:hypothetical protein SDC9_156985 [bioreactor metagenome]|uniref:Uncharacterized protein n=1 Tax=bioreactor metagenome TaxID=1076179 RepID=A0A645FB69_9ZZZZ
MAGARAAYNDRRRHHDRHAVCVRSAQGDERVDIGAQLVAAAGRGGSRSCADDDGDTHGALYDQTAL